MPSLTNLIPLPVSNPSKPTLSGSLRIRVMHRVSESGARYQVLPNTEMIIRLLLKLDRSSRTIACANAQNTLRFVDNTGDRECYCRLCSRCKVENDTARAYAEYSPHSSVDGYVHAPGTAQEESEGFVAYFFTDFTMLCVFVPAGNVCVKRGPVSCNIYGGEMAVRG